MGLDIVLIQLVARWSSQVVLRYLSEAPLAKIFEILMERKAGASLRWSLEELSRHFAELESRREEDRAKIHHLQDELSLLSARSQPSPGRFLMNSASSVVHFPIIWECHRPTELVGVDGVLELLLPGRRACCLPTGPVSVDPPCHKKSR